MVFLDTENNNMSSDNSEMYYTNSIRSKALKLSQPNSLHRSSWSTSCTYGSANTSSPIHFDIPQGHSTPNERKKSMKNISNKAHTVILNAQTDSILYSNTNKSENIGVGKDCLEDVSMTNKIENSQIFNTNATVASDNLKITYNISTLNEHAKNGDTFLNKTGPSDICQMGLNLKMFPKYITPYLNSLKLDFLQLINNHNMAEPDTQIIRGSKTVNDIIKTIENILKCNMNANIETKFKKKKCSTIKFLSVDFNALNVLNHKLDGIHRKIESVGLPLKNKTKTMQKTNEKSATDLDAQHYNDYMELRYSNCFLTDSESFEPILDDTGNVGLSLNNKTKTMQKINEKSATNLDAQHYNEYNDYMELRHSNCFLTDFEPLEPILNSTDNEISSTGNKALTDSSQHIRELKKSIDLSLASTIENTSVSNKINTSPQEKSLENNSLNLVDSKNKDISEATMSHINLPDTEFQPDVLTPVNNSYSNSSHVDVYNNIQGEKNGNQYTLRKFPKPTEHFISPFNPTSVKKKLIRAKSNYKDVFVCSGNGKNKVALQYKLHSVFKCDSSELMKKICPERVNCEKNNKHNSTHFSISNVIPKQIDKPCRCGIFPSQVPPCWNNSLHKSIHQNLHKTRFKCETLAIDVINKINDNGFLYEIIDVTTNCNDKNLKLTLKKINEFINIELNHSTKNIKIKRSNHSILMAVDPNYEIIGYLETEPLQDACIFQNDELSDNLIAVKFGIFKLWVMVKYRNNRVASNLLKQFCDGNNVGINDIAFAYRGSQGISFIKNYFKNNSVLIY